MPSSIPSNWPFIMVTGVFSSCETAEKKFVRACSSSFSCSISASSFLFAFCKSVRAVERLRDSLFRLFPSVPNSSVRCSSTVQSNCKSDIFSDIRLISNTGFVIIREYSQDTTRAATKTISRISGKIRIKDCCSSAICSAAP